MSTLWLINIALVLLVIGLSVSSGYILVKLIELKGRGIGLLLAAAIIIGTGLTFYR